MVNLLARIERDIALDVAAGFPGCAAIRAATISSVFFASKIVALITRSPSFLLELLNSCISL